MKQIRLGSSFGTNNLEVHTCDIPAPGHGVDHILEVGGKEGQINPLQILQAHARVRGIAAGPTSTLEHLCNAIEHNAVTPVIDREFDGMAYTQALNHLTSAQHVGKIVLNL
ncbi:zinc-binding dehydrogenase [Halospina sp. K52047b]|uniref:zinc-binding dehydrogenase n=1 Tax=Halospina sp. K52047b TaxID=2614160 RepID=UPI00124A280E|nr:zinc-binding dehydrogenase [Halospina sp. K52047b]KAA8981924.1 zinc-binding dehydrogenase [Halospina sp. K52047b]